MPKGPKNKDGNDFVRNFAENTWESRELKDKMQQFKFAYHDIYFPTFHLWTSQYSRAYEHMAMYLGRQMSTAEYNAKKLQRRNALTFNHIFRTINSIAGYFEQSQLGFSVQSVSPDAASTRTADILSDCLRRVCYLQDVYSKISSCVREACITGWSALRAYVDMTPGLGPEVKVQNVHWSNLIIDPMFTQRDLSDCNYIAVRSLMPRAKLAGMFPDKAGEIMRIQAGTYTDSNFPWTPQARMPIYDKNKLNYTEMYRMIAKEQEFLYDPIQKEFSYWNGDKQLFRRVKTAYPQVSIVKRMVPVIEYGAIIEDHLVLYAENPYGVNCYPIQPFFAIFDPSFEVDGKVNSLVSLICDAQKAYNKRKNAMLDILDTNLQSGVFFREGTIVNPESLYQIRAGQNICIKNEYTIQEAVQQIAPIELPASLFQATQDLETNINTLLGVNPEMFGQTQGGSEGQVEMSGVLYRMKQASALTGMQPFFSSVRDGQKHFGTILLKMIMANYPLSKIQKISKKELTAEITMQDWETYNIVVQEGLIENRNSNLEHKLALRQLGIPVSTRSIIEDAPVYGKEDLIKYAEEQEQAQSEMFKADLEQKQQATRNLAQDFQSEAAKNQATALETLSSIGIKAAEKEESIARTQKLNADTIDQIVSAIERISQIDPKKLDLAFQLIGKMTENVQEEVEEKKEEVEIDADQAIATRLPPQDLG